MKRSVFAAIVVLLVSLGTVAVGASTDPPASPSIEPAAELTVSTDGPGPFAPGETVEVHVSGARNLSTVAVRQCDVAVQACGMASYVTIGDSGAGTAPVVVRRRVPPSTGTSIVDCAVDPCAFVAQQFGTEIEATASTPMSVDPAAPIPRPTLRIVETDPLDDYAMVTVDGSGFDPGAYVGFYECGWSPPDELIPCANLSMYGFVDSGGSMTASVRVSRLLGDIDCAERVARCQLWAFPYGSVDQIWAVPLGFDGTGPPTRPVLEVSPAVDLVHRQSVQVRGTGFPPGTGVEVRQCLAEPPEGVSGPCGRSTYVPVPATGDFATAFAVQRVIGDQDCAVETCVVRAVASPATTIDAAVSFDASVPPPPLPTLTVDPSTDLTDRQGVSVTVTDVEPASYVYARTCVTATGACRGSASLPVPPGGGTVMGTVTAYRSPADDVDCAIVACEIQVVVSGSGNQLLSAPITFDPGSAFADPPTLRVLPGAGLWDGQVVRVRGEGFDPGAYMYLQQCAGGVSGTASCENVSSSSPMVDADGTIDTTYHIRRTPTLPTGTADCLEVSCSLVASIPGGQLRVSASISFDPDQPSGGTDLPPQLECVPWPTAGWPTGDLPAGVDRDAVEALGDQIVGSWGSDSVVVIHGGRLVYENYADGVDATTIEPSMSMSKSFTSTMVGLLVDDGLLDIDAPGLFPEWSAPGDVRADMTTRHILNMSSGLSWSESYGDPDADVTHLVQASDAAAYVVARPAAVAPGTRFSYSTGDTMLLSRVIGDAAGVSGPTYEAMLQDRLFAPLGIQPVQAGFDQAGRWKAGWYTNTTTRNFAKLGLLYLRHGVWEDEQFLSTDWVDFVRTPAPTNSGYGGQFWLNRDGSFEMVGLGGQNVLIVPQLDLIVGVNQGGGAQSMADLFAGAAPASCGGDQMALTDDDASVDEGGTVLVDVLANDAGGPSGLAPETLTIARAPAHGAATVESGVVRYEADDGFAGSDSFGYLVCSAVRRPCLEATVTVAVGQPPG